MNKTPTLLDAGWAEFCVGIMKLDERAVSALFERERDGRRRVNRVLRLHARLNRLRLERERKELMRELGA